MSSNLDWNPEGALYCQDVQMHSIISLSHVRLCNIRNKTLLSALSHEFSNPMPKDVVGDNDDDDMVFILHFFIKFNE